MVRGERVQQGEDGEEEGGRRAGTAGRRAKGEQAQQREDDEQRFLWLQLLITNEFRCIFQFSAGSLRYYGNSDEMKLDLNLTENKKIYHLK
ncbi:hypothetical protein NDU88_000087 [Pleurodeles waltl]|uniref:Uncharacterized protein n=1 Tax=Pleurodeles waltl TaxID=8319 RepID=A0AAV7L7I0_PLEWA|nr:hypothetical protein NDU88_000087 [Pleurodeles waltl]